VRAAVPGFRGSHPGGEEAADFGRREVPGPGVGGGGVSIVPHGEKVVLGGREGVWAANGREYTQGRRLFRSSDFRQFP
jgi:hypothetical protein